MYNVSIENSVIGTALENFGNLPLIGGSLHNNRSTLILENVSVRNSVIHNLPGATSLGGCYADEGFSTTIMKNVSFYNCRCDGFDATNLNLEAAGGAIYSNIDSKLQLDNVLITNCSSKHGGALFISDSKVSISNSNISFNTASVSGGGIVVLADASINNSTSYLNITSPQFINNSAGAMGAGAIFLYSPGTYVWNNLSFYGNTGSTRDIIISNSAQVNLLNSVFDGCANSSSQSSPTNNTNLVKVVSAVQGHTPSTLKQSNNKCSP